MDVLVGIVVGSALTAAAMNLWRFMNRPRAHFPPPRSELWNAPVSWHRGSGDAPPAYTCPVCGVHDRTAYLRCHRPDCTDGRDPR